MIFSFVRRRKIKKTYKKTVFIAGSGRSGTTWLDELINFRGDSRVLFEPFHNAYVPEWRGYHLRQYLRGDESDAALNRSMTAILNGNLSNKWVDKRPAPPGLDKLIIKDIRANLMLRWIKVNYPHIPIIFLIRHPGAVINSKLKLNWGIHLEDITSQEKLLQDHLGPFEELLTNPEIPVFQQHILMWCIENYVPLRQFKQGGIRVVFYEDLVLMPEVTLKSLFGFIEEPFDERILDRLEQPSSMARPHSAIFSDDKNLILKWKQGIGQEETRMLEETLKIFGLDSLYGPDGLPNPEKLSNIS